MEGVKAIFRLIMGVRCGKSTAVFTIINARCNFPATNPLGSRVERGERRDVDLLQHGVLIHTRVASCKAEAERKDNATDLSERLL